MVTAVTSQQLSTSKTWRYIVYLHKFLYAFIIIISLVPIVYNLTHWKIKMEPENHLFEKENHLPNLHFLVFRGV